MPLPTTLACVWVARVVAAGKHVLVDKPFVDAAGVQAIVEAAQDTGVIFLDGTHFVHSRRTRAALDFVESSCGTLRVINARFSCPLNLKGDIRSNKELEPYGALGDLGWYCARAAVHFLDTARTSVIQQTLVAGRVGEDGDLRELTGVVEFSTDEKPIVDCSFETVLRQRVEVAGTEGTVRINDFVIPDEQFDNAGVAREERVTTQLISDSGLRIKSSPFGNNFPSPSKVTTTTIEERQYAVQSVHMLREFVRMINEKDLRRSVEWANESINTQRILDALYKDCMPRSVRVNGFS